MSKTTITQPTPISRRNALKAGVASMALALTVGPIGSAVIQELTRLAGGRPMTSARLTSILQAERNRWNALLTEIGADRMETPGVAGGWSVKQIVAHLSWYEGRIVAGARQVLDTGAFNRPRDELGALTMDERNERIAAESHQRPLEDVLAEADQVFAQVLAVIAACPDELLNDAQHLGLPNDVPPWMRIANNSYAHYHEHEQAIRTWLARQ